MKSELQNLWEDFGMAKVVELAATEVLSPLPLDIASTLLSTGNASDFDDWQKFKSGDTLNTDEQVHLFSMQALRVMKSCFGTGIEYYSTLTSSKFICNHR